MLSLYMLQRNIIRILNKKNPEDLITFGVFLFLGYILNSIPIPHCNKNLFVPLLGKSLHANDFLH